MGSAHLPQSRVARALYYHKTTSYKIRFACRIQPHHFQTLFNTTPPTIHMCFNIISLISHTDTSYENSLQNYYKNFLFQPRVTFLHRKCTVALRVERLYIDVWWQQCHSTWPPTHRDHWFESSPVHHYVKRTPFVWDASGNDYIKQLFFELTRCKSLFPVLEEAGPNSMLLKLFNILVILPRTDLHRFA